MIKIGVCVLRLKYKKIKKDFYFRSVSNAAVFENTFKSHPEAEKVTFEIISGDIDINKAQRLCIDKNADKHAEVEFMSIFGGKNAKKDI